ncbi:hypothetical protein M3194_05165 [Paenibacillus glycanilyticus]|uniref:hypothetical protein n=1 Tax=Paenibacillus glycanilyticus TaxID=126569 RepID=UPI0020417C58|nr:hypothetical protein [Paenibacillus glycanilyticus]MCM3626750.1 hypothetical protein [Paenibacillus glycanilyticus]
MTENEAKDIAIKFIGCNASEHYTLNFISINKSPRNPNHWSVAFEVRPSNGGVLEGPIFVLVDDSSSEAWFFG